MCCVSFQGEHRTMAAFVLACIVQNYLAGQEAALQGNLVAICLEQLNDTNPLLRQWLAICLARLWTNYDKARWCGVRDTAHEKLYILLQDPVPEVGLSAFLLEPESLLFLLSTFQFFSISSLSLLVIYKCF